MPWFRLDDGFHSHPKVMAAGNAAIGLFVRCGTYCAQHLTDGAVPAAVARMYGSTRDARRLTEVGLWKDLGKDGFLIEDWLDFNPSRVQVLSEREAAAERQRRHRAGRSGGRHAVTNGVTSPAPTRPDPTPAAAAAEGRGSGGASAGKVDERDLPPAVAILASKIRAHTIYQGVRFDSLSAAQLDEIQDLIEIHGDERLVAVAINSRKPSAPVFGQAFIGTWRALPLPGQTLAVVATGPVCDDCHRSKEACTAANAKVAPADRHEFVEAAS